MAQCLKIVSLIFPILKRADACFQKKLSKNAAGLQTSWEMFLFVLLPIVLLLGRCRTVIQKLYLIYYFAISFIATVCMAIEVRQLFLILIDSVLLKWLIRDCLCQCCGSGFFLTDFNNIERGRVIFALEELDDSYHWKLSKHPSFECLEMHQWRSKIFILLQEPFSGVLKVTPFPPFSRIALIHLLYVFCIANNLQWIPLIEAPQPRNN